MTRRFRRTPGRPSPPPPRRATHCTTPTGKWRLMPRGMNTSNLRSPIIERTLDTLAKLFLRHTSSYAIDSGSATKSARWSRLPALPAQPQPNEAEARPGLGDILFQDAWRTPASKFLIPLDTGMYPVFEIPRGRLPAPPSDSTREPASWLLQLAVILLAAGACGYGARRWLPRSQRPRSLHQPTAASTAKNMNRHPSQIAQRKALTIGQ
jgi:hypothetical protein